MTPGGGRQWGQRGWGGEEPREGRTEGNWGDTVTRGTHDTVVLPPPCCHRVVPPPVSPCPPPSSVSLCVTPLQMRWGLWCSTSAPSRSGPVTPGRIVPRWVSPCPLPCVTSPPRQCVTPPKLCVIHPPLPPPPPWHPHGHSGPKATTCRTMSPSWLHGHAIPMSPRPPLQANVPIMVASP